MSYFINWRGTQVSRSLTPFDNVRVPRERRKENKKHEGLPEVQCSPHSQTLQKGEGAQRPEDKTEKGEDKATEEDPSVSKADPRNDAKDWKLPISLGPVYSPLLSSSLSTPKAVGQSWELSPPVAESFCGHDAQGAHLPQPVSFQHFTDARVEKRLAARKERRSRFGNVSVHKCYQFGQVFSPFQALATTEMRKLVFPRDLPMRPSVQRMSSSFSTDVSLQDFLLPSAELGLGKDEDSHEKERPASHMKTPLFPPIVKATKSNDMK
ncbi:uncharacterized protein LOC105861735 [Microcebus murinus]|uniref:uncharacterized protein LOC105861735 n=1 Tax=Microcebus murinus TaxID=30608 RepID=UPI0006434E11|nr:uncharacterized protein LOC105861735 [Microcebus murinus]